MRFGLMLPTAREGLYLPAGFSTSQQLVQLAVQAERLGFYSLWGNDHLTLPKEARNRYNRPPNVYEVLITLAFIGAAAHKVRLGVAALSLPLREPVVLAKQLATLDVFSNGRLAIAVGVGQYREEFTQVRPSQSKADRGAMLEEMLRP